MIIIPHSVLYKIPFGALLTEKVEDIVRLDFTSLPYFIDQYEISYHNSATLYVNVTQQQKALARESLQEKTLVGFAPVFSKKTDNGYILSSNYSKYNNGSQLRSVSRNGHYLKELGYSENELENIIELCQSKQIKALGYFHSDATEKNFKLNAPNYPFIHIATHGIINEQRPQLSAIIFSQPKDSTHKQDGFLYSGEIYNLSLNTDLVVLSSCESGLEKLVKEEGLMALTRAFLYAGAQNLIVSLWKVSDKQTSELMIELYKNIIDSKTYSQSLRQAKRQLIRHENTCFPKFWSGFILLGE